MLNNVPAGINRMARNVIINHPNSFNCKIFGRELVRGGGSEVTPPLGGLGVMSVEDETEFAYEFLDNGFALQVEQFMPSLMSDRLDANNNGDGQEFAFAIQAEGSETRPIKKGDVILIMMGDEVFVAYEVVNISTSVNIPPYVPIFRMNRRNDLDIFGLS